MIDVYLLIIIGFNQGLWIEILEETCLNDLFGLFEHFSHVLLEEKQVRRKVLLGHNFDIDYYFDIDYDIDYTCTYTIHMVFLNQKVSSVVTIRCSHPSLWRSLKLLLRNELTF